MRSGKWKTAAEAMAEFEKDPDFVERRRQREAELRRVEEADARAEAPVVEDLRKAGVPVSSVWDLVNSVNTYAQSLPLLLDHLQRSYPDAIREGIARAMAVPGAKFAWPTLVKLYKQEHERRTKDGLAVALSNIADEETLDEVIALARDARHGESRVLLLGAIERLRRGDARKLLMELGGDQQLHRQVQVVLRRFKKKAKR
jgi:HEAT repeat protein